jgi:hypothetical protein
MRLFVLLLIPALLPAANLHVLTAPNAACSTALPDGRSFLTGGRTPTASLPLAGYFEKDGTLSPASPMLEARAGHVCVAFPDGSVLVAGGETGKRGATNSAEVFHPGANSWTATGAMLTARTGGAAILLNNGKVLVAGGESGGAAANTLEIYDPAQGRFEQAPGILSAPRSRHAIAVLEDGGVLIAGGFDSGKALDSIDLYDPAQNRVVPAGRMSGPRANFTATRLAGGRVLFAGGTDGASELASAEIYDPTSSQTTPAEPLGAARQGQIAIRVPGSDQVLIAAGTAAGRVLDSGEVFVLSLNAFRPAADAGGEDAVATITVGIFGPDMKIQASRAFRIHAAPPRQPR